MRGLCVRAYETWFRLSDSMQRINNRGDNESVLAVVGIQ